MDDRAPGRSASTRARTELERARDIRLAPVGAAIAGALIGWGAIFLKAMLVEAIDGDPGYIVLTGAVIVAAWVGGWLGGVVAVAVSFVLDWVIFVRPVDPLSALEGHVEAARLVIFAVVALGAVALIGSRRASRDRLADALDEASELAAKVEARDERLELMLAASGTGFWEWDVISGELLWSDAIFAQHGLATAPTAPDFPTYLQMIHPDDRGSFTSAIDAAMAGTAPFSIEFRVVWPDGAIHWTHGAARVFRDDDGRPVRMLGTGQDITERRRVADERDRLLAEERRAAEFREAFIDVISHELRTPITTILGISQLLTRPGRADDPAMRTPLLEDVRSESERLHRLVEDLLVLSRVERGGLVVDAEPLEPRRLLERLIAHEAVELPSIDIELQVDADLPIVAGEATYVEQIVRNLLGNAAKYTPAGTRVVVQVGREEGEVAIRVLDQGRGVPEASIERIFELFYRDPDSARTVAGSGIGLFVCASLVAAMGGHIWVERRPEGGSEFGFTLRVLAADEDGLDHGLPSGSTRSSADSPR
ncbi:MAG: ATP-binding protein [Candidatus Limnocylindrales bacterium]